MIATLIGEGSSDRALLPILRWLLAHCGEEHINLDWVDTQRVAASRKLADKIRATLIVRSCDLLFVHRDADNQPVERRHREIQEAAMNQRYVAVVPVRMTEAWLLIDEMALRAATGRSSGTKPLNLPSPGQIENVANPKAVLHEALRRAHDATGRRARRFKPSAVMHRLSDLVEDWSPLLSLSAFQRLEKDTRAALESVKTASDSSDHRG